MEATQCILTFRNDQDNLLKSKVSIRMGQKGDLSDSEYNKFVGASESQPRRGISGFIKSHMAGKYQAICVWCHVRNLNKRLESVVWFNNVQAVGSDMLA